MRRVWILFLALACVACGAPDTQATATRTAEIVELTVAARTLPTQNAAVPPTPIPAATPVPTSVSLSPPIIASVNPPVALRTPISLNTPDPYGYSAPAPHPDLINGSWVAYSPAIRTRFFAPPSLVEDPEFSSDHRYSLSSPSNVFDFEALDIYRFVGTRGGDFSLTWQQEIGAYNRANTATQLFNVTSGPRQQQIGAYQGNIGQFNYIQMNNALEIDGTMWVGQVGGDEVVMIYRCAAERAAILDTEIAQVMATIDFNAL